MEQRDKNTLMRRFAANTGWLVAQNVFQYVLSAVIGILAARFLGPSNFGVLGYGAAMMALFSPICTLGTYGIQITDMTEHPEETGGIIGTTLLLRSGATVFTIGLITVAVLILRPGERLLLVVTVLQSLQLLFEVFDALRLWFQMKLMSKYTAIGSVVGNIACSIWRIALLMQGASVEWFALTSAVQMLTNYLFVVPVFFRRSTQPLYFSRAIAKRLLQRGKHYLLASLTGGATRQFGKLFTSSTLGDVMLGYYNAAYSLATMWLFVPNALIDSAFPILLQQSKGDPGGYRRRYQLLLMLVLGIGTMAGLFLCLFAPWIIRFLYGEAYAPAADALRILAWMGIFSNIGSARNIFVQVEGAQSSIKHIALWTAAFTILFNLLLIPPFGLIGASVACVLGFVGESIVATGLRAKTRPFLTLYAESFSRSALLAEEVRQIWRRWREK